MTKHRSLLLTAPMGLLLAAAVPLVTQQPAPPRFDDARVLTTVDNAHSSEIEAAMMAEQKGQAKEVRELAARLREDHTRARQEGRELAQRLGIVMTPRDSMAPMPRDTSMRSMPDTSMNRMRDTSMHRSMDTTMRAYPDTASRTSSPRDWNDGKKDLAKLQGKTGAEFDRAFLDQQVKAHQDNINAVSGPLMSEAQNADVKAYLQKLVPSLRAHLTQIQTAKSQLKM